MPLNLPPPVTNVSLPPGAGVVLTSLWQKVLVAVVVLAAPFLLGLAGNTWVWVLDFAVLYALLAVGLNLVVGSAGLLDLGYIAFYGVGAYTWAFLASPHFGLHWPFWVILPLAAALAALAGVLLGFPTLRMHGDYLAIVTLGFGEIVRIFLLNLTHPVNITNGPKGIDSIDGLRLFGWELNRGLTYGDGERLGKGYLYYYVFLAMVLVAVLASRLLQRSRIGRAWAALRDDELAAKAVGLNTQRLKLLAFATGASIGGAAGCLFAAFQGFVSPESFTLMESIAVLTMVVFGGMGSLRGVILGAVALTFLPEILRQVAVPVQQAVLGQVLLDPEVMRVLLLAFAMAFMMLLRPQGLFPARSRYIHEAYLRRSTSVEVTP